MFITHALSYGNAWSRLSTDYKPQFDAIHEIVSLLTPESAMNAKPSRNYDTQGSIFEPVYRFQGLWGNLMDEFGWGLSSNPIYTANGRRLSIRQLGYMNGNISINFLRQREVLNRWLYTTAPMASRHGEVDIPVALVLKEDAYNALFPRISSIQANIFNLIRDELLALSPLSHASPFLILAVSLQPSPIDVIDLSKEHGVQFRQIVVNRSIEFPRQYHQAGLGVLTYFGTVLREKYPNHDAKVRIEQDGLTVRMVIESDNGDREIIEKALEEYEMVVRGERPPEMLLADPASIIELKNELRIAQVRIESQRDIISLQGEQITSLRQLMGNSLSRQAQPVFVSVQPAITITNQNSQCTEINACIPDISDDLSDLLLVVKDESMRTRILDLTEALDAAEMKSTPEAVKGSSGISKLRSFIEDAAKTGSKANEVLKSIENGVGIIQGLGKKYNAVAEWCGAPQIPNIILGGAS